MTIANCILGLILELALRWHERCAAAGPATAARAFSKAQNKKSARRSHSRVKAYLEFQVNLRPSTTRTVVRVNYVRRERNPGRRTNEKFEYPGTALRVRGRNRRQLQQLQCRIIIISISPSRSLHPWDHGHCCCRTKTIWEGHVNSDTSSLIGWLSLSFRWR